MVDWKNPDVIAYTFFLYEQITVILVGFYGTHFVNTFYVEWELIQRKRAFRLVHIPFLLARYITLTALLFFVITGRVNGRIACDPAYRIFASLGTLAGMLASLIICSRPIAIFWTLRSYIPLYILKLGALGQGFLVVSQAVWTVRSRWDAAMNRCTVITWDATFLAAFYLYTSVFDILILVATLVAVRRVHEEQTGSRPWGVGSVLCVQGIGYVAATGAANLPVAVLAFLDLNAAMDVLLSQPAMTIGVIMSSLAFLGLEDAAAKARLKAAPARAHARAPSGSADLEFVGSSTSTSDGDGDGDWDGLGSGIVSTHIPIHLSAIGADSTPDFDETGPAGLVFVGLNCADKSGMERGTGGTPGPEDV